MLIGFQDQGNLGLGYLAAVLRQAGHQVLLRDVETDPDDILRAVQDADPILIGFSLIFQLYVDRLGALARHLRHHGITCHFTMGGHFPSLSYQHTLKLIPELDSVVRFEGEVTLRELVDRLSAGRDWRDIQGIAYPRDSTVVANPLRPLIVDLDELPYPARDFPPEAVLGRSALPLLASRGCARTCSFCSIHTFYRTAPGKVVRTRKPQQVAEEMHALHQERGVSIFLFQDDDFPLFGPVWRRWAMEFLEELHRKNLPGRVIWKISCRADAVEHALFASLRQAGLYLVYLGLESGNEDGLRTLNKGVTVEQNLRAVSTLKQLDITCEFGFMLFDPSSTFQSVRANVEFLRTVLGDGSGAAVFGRMLPFDGTPIQAALQQAGRLRGDLRSPDYAFLDPRLDGFYAALTHLLQLSGWFDGARGLAPQINWAWNEVAVMERLFPPLAGMVRYQQQLRAITQAANEWLFRMVEDLSYACSDGKPIAWSAEEPAARCRELSDRLLKKRDGFVARRQRELLRALDQPSPLT